MNASLWTLPIEGRLYLYLALAIFLLRYNRIAIVVLVLAMATSLIISGKTVTIEQPTFRLGLLFISGAGMASIEERFGPTSALPPAIRWLQA